MLKRIFLMVLMAAVFILSGCAIQSEAAQNVNGDLKISMLNIGHGDAVLIRTGKQTILIDSANVTKHTELVRELEKLSVTKIDKLILTHPHIDHIGGAKMLMNPSKKDLNAYPYLEKISVAKVYDNGVAHVSKTYKGYMETARDKKIPRQALKAGDTLDLGNGVKFKVISPTAEFVDFINVGDYDKKDRANRMNNTSIVGKLTYKNFSMMFTGDCEKESEAKILANNKEKDLKCDVLKSGHHGINTSSSKKFVAAINPSCVLVSAGYSEKDGVEVGFPQLKVLQKYLAAGVDAKNIFCTRFNGTITLTSDGKNFSVKTETKEDWVDKWIAHLKATQKK